MEHAKRKAVSGTLLMLLLANMLALAFNIQPVKAEPRTWTVDDDLQEYPAADFTKIQEAVNAAATGDTIVVYPGTYSENVDVNKSLTIKSENGTDVTIVRAVDYDDHVFAVTTDYVNIIGFTVEGATGGWKAGIYLLYADYCNISHNIVSNNLFGIRLDWSTNCTLSNNIASNNSADGIFLRYSRMRSFGYNIIINNICSNNGNEGIDLEDSHGNNIVDNICLNNNNGIILRGSTRDLVANNTCSSNRMAIGLVENSRGNNITQNILLNNSDIGVLLGYSALNNLKNNNVSNNNIGIQLISSTDNNILENRISSGTYGIYSSDSSNNTIYHNDFIDNIQQVYSSTSKNIWDNSYPFGGNYWSDYTDVDLYSGPYQNETGSDGIWDHPYVIDENNKDRYPLVNPWIPTLPKFRVGDWVQTTTNLNVREGPGLNYTIISTMALGTIGQIFGGPVEADGFVWWDVDYAVGVRGWSVENWLELYPVLDQPPTCVVKLQKDGVEIDEINVWDFFDIYVGDSTSDKGIKQVRFSSDNIQDGYPTGRWTEWYDWHVSSEDWNTTTKIKRWAFAAPGYKEVWAEVKDEIDQTAVCLAKIFVPAPALPVLTSPLVITPIKDIYNVGDSLEAEFTIKNIGDTAITLDVLTVGGRLNGFIPPEGAPDFTFQSVTLQSNESYQYQGSLTLNQTGNYRFFIAYYIENPTPDEERLLDENNWNTCMELGEGLTHTDRVKNIIVFEEGTIPEDVFQLSQKIDRWMNRERQYPAYLIDPDVSWAASVWITVSSIWTDVQEDYDELWLAGVEHDVMSRIEAVYARKSLDRGDIYNAKEHLQRCFLNYKVSNRYFYAAAQIYDHSVEDAMVAVQNTLDMITFGLNLANPAAGKFASYVFMIPKFIAEVELVGENRATIQAIGELVFKFLFSEIEYPELGGRTLQNYLNNRVGKLTFPVLQGIFRNNEALQFHLSHALKQLVTWETEWLSSKFLDELSKQFPAEDYKAFSPVELRVYDSEGKFTGVMNGSVRHEISRSFYRNGTLTIFFPSDSYFCEVSGEENGTYGLVLTHVDDGNLTSFTATGIPMSPNATHQHIVDWNALSIGEEGVTIVVDADGNGAVDRVFSSDSELTSEEFNEKTSSTYPTHILTISAGENGTVFPLPGTYTCSANSTVQVIAIPHEGYALDYWELDSINVGSANPYTVLMQANHTVNAVFRLGLYDVAVTDVVASRPIVGEGYGLNINLTVANSGDFTETFNLTLSADAATIETIELVLAGGTATTITVLWNTTGVAYGNYTLWAHADPIPGETNTVDNTFVYGWIVVTVPGDVDGDGDVDIFDIVHMAGVYGVAKPDPRYDTYCDIDGDGDIDIFDIVIAAGNYGKTDSHSLSLFIIIAQLTMTEMFLM